MQKRFLGASYVVGKKRARKEKGNNLYIYGKETCFKKFRFIHKIQNYTAVRKCSAYICPDNRSCQNLLLVKESKLQKSIILFMFSKCLGVGCLQLYCKPIGIVYLYFWKAD